MTKSINNILCQVFGYNSFRGPQKEIIQHVVNGGDALVLMPTGGGKSLCYQIPAICREGIGIVVSPLIALMRDQVEMLRQLGVRAAMLNSSLGQGEASDIMRSARAGLLDLLYIAPERLLLDGTLDFITQCKIALFALNIYNFQFFMNASQMYPVLLSRQPPTYQHVTKFSKDLN